MDLPNDITLEQTHGISFRLLNKPPCLSELWEWQGWANILVKGGRSLKKTLTEPI